MVFEKQQQKRDQMMFEKGIDISIRIMSGQSVEQVSKETGISIEIVRDIEKMLKENLEGD